MARPSKPQVSSDEAMSSASNSSEDEHVNEQINDEEDEEELEAVARSASSDDDESADDDVPDSDEDAAAAGDIDEEEQVKFVVYSLGLFSVVHSSCYLGLLCDKVWLVVYYLIRFFNCMVIDPEWKGRNKVFI